MESTKWEIPCGIVAFSMFNNMILSESTKNIYILVIFILSWMARNVYVIFCFVLGVAIAGDFDERTSLRGWAL